MKDFLRMISVIVFSVIVVFLCLLFAFTAYSNGHQFNYWIVSIVSAIMISIILYLSERKTKSK